MRRTKRTNLEKVKASLDTICPKCGHRIEPREIRRVNFEQVSCPKCGAVFQPKLDR